MAADRKMSRCRGFQENRLEGANKAARGRKWCQWRNWLCMGEDGMRRGGLPSDRNVRLGTEYLTADSSCVRMYSYICIRTGSWLHRPISRRRPPVPHLSSTPPHRGRAVRMMRPSLTRASHGRKDAEAFARHRRHGERAVVLLTMTRGCIGVLCVCNLRYARCMHGHACMNSRAGNVVSPYLRMYIRGFIHRSEFQRPVCYRAVCTKHSCAEPVRMTGFTLLSLPSRR